VSSKPGALQALELRLLASEAKRLKRAKYWHNKLNPDKAYKPKPGPVRELPAPAPDITELPAAA